MLFAIPLIVLLILAIFIFVKKEGLKNPELKKKLLILGFACALLAMFSLLAAFYISHDYTYLLKMALPALLLVNIYSQLNASKL
jgi:hypothetical protein